MILHYNSFILSAAKAFPCAFRAVVPYGVFLSQNTGTVNVWAGTILVCWPTQILTYQWQKVLGTVSDPFHAGSGVSTVCSNYLHSVCTRIQLKIKCKYLSMMWRCRILRRVFWVRTFVLLYIGMSSYILQQIKLYWKLKFHHVYFVFFPDILLYFFCLFLQFYLQDTKSSNGTFINSQRLSRGSEESPPCEIMSGDIIQFGVDVTENTRKGKGMDHSLVCLGFVGVVFPSVFIQNGLLQCNL